ncbi:MAG: hypothetical protein AB1730_21790 [Myxococcota bacterium]|jgi:hypothetical protein
MGLLRFVVWTGMCVALGVWVGAGQVGGKTPLEHAQRLWKGSGPALERDAKDLVTGIKKKVASAAAPTGPKEQHTAEDRAAIDDIIAKRPAKN